MKEESSGFPLNCCTDEQKDEFIQTYFEREGVILDKDNIKKDGGRKAFAKFCLNNLRGFLPKSISKGGTHFVTSGRELIDLLDDSTRGWWQCSLL